MDARELDMFEMVAVLAAKMPEEIFTKPDDDWTPVAFLETPDGQVTMPLAPYMGSPQEKDVLSGMLLPAAITEMKASRLVMVLSVWVGKAKSKEEFESEDFVPPSQQPERVEKVMIMEYTREGITRSTSALIIRHENAPPTLGEWEDDFENVDRTEGRFVGTIVKALKAVQA